MRATDAFPSRVTPQAEPGRATLRRKANPQAAAARRVSPPGSSDATPHPRPAPYPQVNISREDRIRGHVLLCWLALLLTRIAENAAGDTWRNLRRELHQLAAIESARPDGTIIETTRPTPAQQRIYTACNVALPPRFLGIHPA
jgi:hypothetical protein